MITLFAFINALEHIIRSPLLIGCCLLLGLYFSARTGFAQLRLTKQMIKLSFAGRKSPRGISAFQALCTGLAGRIGIGNIAGTALAIFWGGPGALFWLWLASFLGAASACIEATLAQLYKVEIAGVYRGGPAYYIGKGLKSPGIAMLFAGLALCTCGLFLPAVQGGAIAAAFGNAFNLPFWLTCALVALLLVAVIGGGLKRIVPFLELLLPFAVIIYVVVALVVIIANIGQLWPALRLILRSAFGIHAVFGGLLGQAVVWGAKCGVFAHADAVSSHAAAAAEAPHPAQQGLVQAFSVYINAFFVCTATGLLMLMTGSYNIGVGEGYLYQGAGPAMDALAESGARGHEFVQAAVSTLLPGSGAIFVACCAALFAFMALLACYYCAETNLVYILRSWPNNVRKRLITALRLLTVLAVLMPALLPQTNALVLSGIGLGLMAWLNLAALWLLRKEGLLIFNDYQRQLKQGHDPLFDAGDYSDIQGAELWLRVHEGGNGQGA